MITFLNKKNKLNEQRNSLNVSYLREVNIILGHYPYPDIIHKLLLDVKNNIDPKMKNYTHVKGGMTDWYYFLNNPSFEKFFSYLINKHQSSHPHIFEYFLERKEIIEAWGNEIVPGDRLNPHIHDFMHGVLYLSEGCDLILPELNIAITPHPGDYYIFPPQLVHGFDKYEGDTKRYSLVFNVTEKNQYDFNKKVESMNGKNS